VTTSRNSASTTGTSKPRSASLASTLPVPSRTLLRWFHRYLRWYLPRHFHSIRVAHAIRFTPRPGVANIVVLNHASWWDPLLCLLLANRLLPAFDHYAPMDAAALEQYRFFRRLGLFPVEQGTPRGASQFLRSSPILLSRPNSMLWITPQGRLSDAREQPHFQPGLAALLHQLGPCRVLSLAIEYPFVEERLPEALVLCGQPLDFDSSASLSIPDLSSQLEASLANAQQELARLVIDHDLAPFESLLAGGSGTGAVYEYWRRLRAQLTGQPYQPEHGSIRRP
jgi:1-acyl-sn-glycerol-3-phosphate acyltransferase